MLSIKVYKMCYLLYQQSNIYTLDNYSFLENALQKQPKYYYSKNLRNMGIQNQASPDNGYKRKHSILDAVCMFRRGKWKPSALPCRLICFLSLSGIPSLRARQDCTG